MPEGMGKSFCSPYYKDSSPTQEGPASWPAHLTSGITVGTVIQTPMAVTGGQLFPNRQALASLLLRFLLQLSLGVAAGLPYHDSKST